MLLCNYGAYRGCLNNAEKQGERKGKYCVLLYFKELVRPSTPCNCPCILLSASSSMVPVSWSL